MPHPAASGTDEACTRPEARETVLDRFKRARTTSPDTDCSSTDADTSERIAYTRPPAATHPLAADDEEDMTHKHDEAVDSLLQDPELQLHDARSADPLVRDVAAAKAARPRIGETWYVVPARWYKTFIADPAGTTEIDTTALHVPGTQRLRMGTMEGIDFELVPRAAWDQLVARYGQRGPALPCAVIAGAHATHAPRIELFPPTLDLVRIGTPGAAPTSVPSLTLSAASTLGKLKAQTRAVLALRVDDADLRFVRVPASLRTRAEAQGGVVAEVDVRTVVPLAEVVEGAESATLGALQLDAPQSVLAVDVRTDGHWQVHLAPMRLTRSARGASGAVRGLRGLANLGNTCFMNSALQCLSNTPELQRYFLHEVHYDEINTDNPLGMGGAIAGAFGRLMQQLWSAQHSGAVVPREFKTALARFAPQFTGYAQQDSQELLAFLLDGLHEDLNRILQKPYIEAPDWPGGSDADMVRFAQQQWDIYKARNDSMIVDLFQGQYRSTLVCPVCDKVSIKFDPFMYLTLPIPNTRKWRGRVYVVGRTATPAVTQLDVQLPATATVAQLREKAAAVLGLDAATLVVGEVWSHHVYRWLADYEPVRDISAGDYVYLWEQPAPFAMPAARKAGGRLGFLKGATRSIADLETSFAPPAASESVTLPVYSCLAPDASGASRFGSFRRTLGEGFGLPFFVTVAQADARNADAIVDAMVRQYIRFSKHPTDSVAAFRERMASAPRSEGATPDTPVCEVRFAAPPSDETMHRGDEASEHTTEPLDARMARLTDPAGWPPLYNGGALFCLWDAAAAHALFDAPPPSHAWGEVREVQDPEFEKTSAQLADGRRRTPKLQLDDCLDEFTRAEQLGEHDLWYCPQCKEFRQAMKKFDLWKVPDILVVHLKRFSAGRMARDKLDNFIDFPITGLDLSDRVVGTQLVHELQLDAPPAVTQGDKFRVAHDAHDDEVAADRPIYDLYAVDNHFGGLGGGHYTAFAKNPEDGRWYNYDDSSVRPVSDPETVKSSAAYLLFYRRRTTREIGGKSSEKTRAHIAAGGSSAQPPPAPALDVPSSYLGDTPLPPSDDSDSSDDEAPNL
ncbi:hypothetical protein CBS9595_000471 [Malassezia furfur]|nr:hypothetical protein CBS9595_000471 [Malassezia furfur]